MTYGHHDVSIGYGWNRRDDNLENVALKPPPWHPSFGLS
ncbi:hypothetical protein Pla22_04870 [Rubripirellula amarantea]|uniref:Uncharacterized protein n=1 Tax=Rubripirellula amarantea TaxID=2527999 RepID=A0A5C5WRN9_9BACT|nr:hypothetical protein Pla22_04870 [Rubripirellula amarantea]